MTSKNADAVAIQLLKQATSGLAMQARGHGDMTALIGASFAVARAQVEDGDLIASLVVHAASLAMELRPDDPESAWDNVEEASTLARLATDEGADS